MEFLGKLNYQLLKQHHTAMHSVSKSIIGGTDRLLQ
jgi:hypothetical protein